MNIKLFEDRKIYFWAKVLLQSCLILVFYYLFIRLGLIYNALGMSKKSFGIIVFISNILPLYVPPVIFIVFVFVLKLEISTSKLIINSLLTTLLAISLVDFVTSPGVFLGIFIFLLIIFLTQNYIKRKFKK